jgi:glutathione S-transferase
MTPEDAIEIAKKAQPIEAKDWSSEGQNVGLKPGDWVSVTPDDYGNPVFGSLLAWKAEEVVIRHEDPSVGRVNLHFPRAGFDVRPAEEKKAA